MTNLFDNKDILTIATAEQAVVGATGFFGDNLYDLTDKIKHGDVGTLSSISRHTVFCFDNENKVCYALFLPSDKVKKSSTYRPLANIDELFDFFYPPKDDVYNQIEKAEILLGKKLVLKKLENDQIKAMVIQDIEFNNTNGNTYINNLSLDYIFHVYDIEKDDKWVTFGIKED